MGDEKAVSDAAAGEALESCAALSTRPKKTERVLETILKVKRLCLRA